MITNVARDIKIGELFYASGSHYVARMIALDTTGNIHVIGDRIRYWDLPDGTNSMGYEYCVAGTNGTTSLDAQVWGNYITDNATHAMQQFVVVTNIRDLI